MSKHKTYVTKTRKELIESDVILHQLIKHLDLTIDITERQLADYTERKFNKLAYMIAGELQALKESYRFILRGLGYADHEYFYEKDSDLEPETLLEDYYEEVPFENQNGLDKYIEHQEWIKSRQ